MVGGRLAGPSWWVFHGKPLTKIAMSGRASVVKAVTKTATKAIMKIVTKNATKNRPENCHEYHHENLPKTIPKTSRKPDEFFWVVRVMGKEIFLRCPKNGLKKIFQSVFRSVFRAFSGALLERLEKFFRAFSEQRF